MQHAVVGHSHASALASAPRSWDVLSRHGFAIATARQLLSRLRGLLLACDRCATCCDHCTRLFDELLRPLHSAC